MSMLYLRMASEAYEALDANEVVEAWRDDKISDPDASCECDSVAEAVMSEAVEGRTAEMGAMLTAWALRAETLDDFKARVFSLEVMVQEQPYKLILLMLGNFICGQIGEFEKEGELDAVVSYQDMLVVVGDKLGLEATQD